MPHPPPSPDLPDPGLPAWFSQRALAAPSSPINLVKRSEEARASSAPCAACQRRLGLQVRLDQEDGRQTLTLCLPCLRTSLLLQAARNEARGVRLLRQAAADLGLPVWCSGHVVYLLPALATNQVPA
jgi:hypothetical protein